MAIKNRDGSFSCMFCDYRDNNPSIVNDHISETHDYVLVPFLREDLIRLLQYIMTKGIDSDGLITERLYNKLRDYSRFQIKAKE